MLCHMSLIFHFSFLSSLNCMSLYVKWFQFCIFSPKNLDISELLHILKVIVILDRYPF